MEEFKRCLICQGSGRVMGGGMIFHDCKDCDGFGKIKNIGDEISYLQITQSESYKDAVADIKKMDPKLTTDDADKLLQKQLHKRRKTS